MSKQPSDNDVLFSKRNDEAFTRQQRKSNKGGYNNRNNNSNYVNGNLNTKNFGISDGLDEIVNKSKQNGVATDNIEKISNIKQQILSKKQSSLLIEKEQIDDENARGFDHVFMPNVSKLSSSRQRDYENSLSSRGDSKFTVKSEQSSLLFQSNPNQNNSLSINNNSNINNKVLQQSGHHHQLSNNIHNELENKSSKVANLNSQFDKSASQRSNQTQQLQQQSSNNQHILLNQLNQNSHNLHFSIPHNALRSQVSLNFNEADSINQYLKQEHSNNIDINQLNGLTNQFQSQDQIQLLQLQSIQQKSSQQQPFINIISSQNVNSNFNNDLLGGGSYGGLNSLNDFPLNSIPHNYRHFLKNENTNSIGYNSNNLPKNDLFDEEEDEGKGISYYWDIKEENNEDNSTLLGANLMNKLGMKAMMGHKNNCSSPNNQGNNSYSFNNIGYKKQQIKQESILSSNPNDQTNLIEQARSQNDDNSNNGDPNDENKTLRGLRILSLKVKQIVQEKGSTTYKEVAETLVQNLKTGQKQLGEEAEIRDEQNIKRRVYDALNVLIASEVIAKKGKKVLAIPKTNLTGKCLKSQNWEEAKKQQDVLDRQREKVNQKKQQVQEYAKKYLALKNLIERNQTSEKNTQLNSQFFENFINKKEDYEENQRLFLNSQMSNNPSSQNLKDNVLQTQIDLSSSKFQFPLITVTFNPDDSSRVILKMNKEKTNLKMYAKGYLQTLGDLDILCKMNLDQVSDNFKQEVLGDKYLQWVNSIDQLKIGQKIPELQMNQYQNNHNNYMLNAQDNY